ncbi:hypothetical protein [Moraxella bovis]|uniref:Uncharacterized protein n=2 Tax=Moraxella bovis TaxID=476 RepID=A0AAQ2Q270_MORBO|nr:hypothetical protein [Moraxella bovis]AWY19553.1 hypothetical protein DQF64_02865 [Moraxella bovis]AWY21052.1 hypothetical protein DQF64_11515 [Moraxella bovis]AWY21072.1 hypothetical protein DQF64_11630 [Moraxella bovis]UYZ75327.1 hypothetical protein LP093_11345 [Moraxella bovis]UYZ76280.1 hypothetical protein LP093_02875 [Moraxella bovis]
MSYLNPITLTPKLYQSTDLQAPQLTGAMGDYKSVWKACLVTGYGNKAGAGFMLDNETDHSCDFISPNIMMDKFGVEEDNSAYKPYYYNGTNKVSQWPSNTQKSHARNPSWTMLVCELGVYFVITTNGMSQVGYLGLIKSAINDNNINFVRLNIGNLSSSSYNSFLGSLKIGNYTNARILSNGYDLVKSLKKDFLVSLVSDVFWRQDGALLGSQPALLIQNSLTLPTDIQITEYQGRPVLYIYVVNGTNSYYQANYSFGVMIYLDYWEY